MRRLALLAGSLVLVTTLFGCGGDGSAYCDRIRGNVEDQTLNRLDVSVPGDLKKLGEEARALGELAPQELHADYAVLSRAFEGDQVNPTEAIADIEAYDEVTCDVEYTD
ncbi:MAG: hypothetical protein H0U28_08030 [Nocardioidaceae bacterium]|nr:hypothetical protein [Nocardioidaceae bacterium]